MLFSGNVNTAMLTGFRSLTLADANAADVESEIRIELRRAGINTATIAFDPADFDASNLQVDLTVDVPANRENGLSLSRLTFGGASSIRRTITVDRETR